MTNKRIYQGFIFTIIVSILGCRGCGDNHEPLKQGDAAFSQYISGFTSGIISRKSTIKIRLADPSNKFTKIDLPLEEELYDFSPGVDGEAYWLDNQTLEFRPESSFESGTRYAISFSLGKVMDVERKFEVFEYEVQTIQQTFDVRDNGIVPYEETSLIWNSIEGELATADYLEDKIAENLLQASQGGRALNIRWNHDQSGRIHHFTVDSVERKEEAGKILFEWSGTDYGIRKKGKREVEIPSLSDFKLMNVDVVQQPEQRIIIRFSDPLDKEQDLNGLIKLENYSSFRFVIEGNKVIAYPEKRQQGNQVLVLDKGIKNILDYGLKEQEKIEIAFIEVKPAMKLSGNGVIIPNSDGLIFPFQAVNLKAVDVRIIKIYENNIGQFLQSNNLDGSYEWSEVGRVVVKKKINLVSESAIDYGVWNSFTLDLAELIQAEPGAIYRVQLNFRKAYSIYPCTDDNAEKEEDEKDYENSWDQSKDEGYQYWGYYDSYFSDFNYYYYNYDWKERDNPCHSSYYRRNHSISRNILASNIGLIAKSGSDKKLLIAAIDIPSAKPLSGIRIELYSFQHQLIGEVRTDKKGMAEVDLEMKPFLLIAKNGKERGYLKLDDGTSLSVSKFDVGGDHVQSGVKGYIYGERGVWRPGDTLFLTFILEDKNKILPKDHPVKFELVNPQGQVTHRRVKTESKNGFYTFVLATDKDAPTGSWHANVKVGAASFRKNLKIEAIKPNRLKIKIDFGVKELSVEETNVRGKMEVKWLHGAVARNLRAHVAVTLTPGTTSFKKYKDFNFYDPARKFSSSEQVLFDARIDEEGLAEIIPDINVSNVAPGKLRANFVTRVFEESGDFSIDRFSIPYSPYKVYVGIKVPEGTLVTDTFHKVDIVTVDHNGNPVDVEELQVKIYKVQWRWWWEGSQENFAQYVGSSYHGWYQEFTASTVNGKGSIEFKVEYPDWGRYLIRVTDRKNGHSAGSTVYIDWPGWITRDSRDNPGGAAMLSFSSDKESYTVGENASITIPASSEGRALVTIETGSKVLDAKWIEVTGKEIHYNIPITSEMAPNVYVYVTLIQPHKHGNDLPIRLYGVIPLMVEDPATIVKPVINMPDELAPESKFRIKISEKEGKSMTYTIAIVDEGLLDLTRFKTPDPHPSFYAREALGVKTWDLYDMILGGYGASLERLLSIGGDEGATGKGKDKINRFKPMVRFLGPFDLGRKRTAEHIITMPNYIGSVRTMVIAGKDGAYGSSEKTTPVKKPLMVLATLPRVLGPDEKVKLPVTVFAMEDNIKNVKITIKANKLFTAGYSSTKTIRFDKPGDQVVNFDLQVASAIGKGEVTVKVTSGKETAIYDIELEIRNPNPRTSKFQDGVVNAGATWEADYTLFGVDGTNEVTLELSNMPPIDFERRLKWLLGYPHGCIEQTVSQAFPQLYLADVMEVDKRVEARTSDNVKSALRKINNFQFSNGGFAYWPNGTKASDWGTSYAGHFMLEAEAKGYTLPIGMKNKWIAYQRKTAKSYSPHVTSDSRGWHVNNRYDFAQAYRLYTLALAGKPELGAMNRMKANNKLRLTGKWRLAVAYHLAGYADVASKIVAGISTYVPTSGNDSYTYGSVDRDKAMILEAMSIMGKRNEAITIMKQISSSLTRSRWMSTQTTAYCLLAMVKFAGDQGTSNEMKFSYNINGKTGKLTSLLPLKQINIDVNKGRAGHISLSNTGSGLMYARLIVSGIPAHGEETASSSNLSIDVTYTTMQGVRMDITNIEQGTDFLAFVSIGNPNPKDYYRDMALTQIFPSGWEIHNTRMDGFESVHQMDRPRYIDIRDDRVYTYFDLCPDYPRATCDNQSFVVILNAAYMGEFYLPAVLAESMYDNNISARTAGQWVRVVKPGELP